MEVVSLMDTKGRFKHDRPFWASKRVIQTYGFRFQGLGLKKFIQYLGIQQGNPCFWKPQVENACRGCWGLGFVFAPCYC